MTRRQVVVEVLVKEVVGVAIKVKGGDCLQ